MTDLDSLKEEIKREASDDPEKFFATEVLKEKDFSRSKCENCDVYFWSKDPERSVCGEPECSGGYTFIGDSPIEKTYTYTEVWKEFKEFMDGRGYKIIDRYPVVARWRNDVEFVGAAIYNFQPYVVSGEVEPPAPELVVPQPSLRFNDVDNVGVTGRHYVLHNHIGQTCFQPPEKYDQNRYFKDMIDFALEVLEIPDEKLILHEDAWGGGGNLGACMEFFVDGLELWNQVYMFYEVTGDSYRELDLKVLDMGMGHERITWISHGSETSYESVMPKVLKKMKENIDVDVDEDTWKKFLPYSGNLDVDEVEDIEKEWENIANEIGMSAEELKGEIRPAAAMYSVAEHTRALLFALADGKLPSNTGSGHDLRMIARRSMSFIDEYDWDLSLEDVAEWHAEELEEMFPELKERMGGVKKILKVEREKYEETKKETEKIIERLSKDELTEERIIELYDSKGVAPQMLEREFDIEIPQNFYSKVAERHNEEERSEKGGMEIGDIEDTEKLYYDKKEFEGTVVGIVGEYVAFDRTAFYPTSGGQVHDKGEINGMEVTEVIMQSNTVLHKIPGHDLEEGDHVEGQVDKERRDQITQHHSATHIVNVSSREILGSHIWQAGAYKDMEKGRLDITHYEIPSEEEIRRIQERANEITDKEIPVNKTIMDKNVAEKKYGFVIYQGGVVPGNQIRIVKVGDLDAEACGGTHVDNTREVGDIIITDVKKVQDSVIRLEFTAGDRTREFLDEIEDIAEKCKDILDCDEEEIPEESERLFKKWKESEKQLEGLENQLAERAEEEIEFREVSGKDLLIETVEGGMEELENISKNLTDKNTCMLLFGTEDDRINILGSTGETVDLNIGEIVKEASERLGGKGGGGPALGQGIGNDLDKLDETMDEIEKVIVERLG